MSFVPSDSIISVKVTVKLATRHTYLHLKDWLRRGTKALIFVPFNWFIKV
jgi:predicted patatin/cPLA2 family phospholipase